MDRKERHPSRRAQTAQKGCAGCLLCRGSVAGARPKQRAPAACTVQLRPGTAARFFVV